MHPNNKLTINVVEAAPLDQFSPEVGAKPCRAVWGLTIAL